MSFAVFAFQFATALDYFKLNNESVPQRVASKSFNSACKPIIVSSEVIARKVVLAS